MKRKSWQPTSPGGAADGLYIGLMSGTSMDAIDAALVQWVNNKIALIATHSHPLSSSMRLRIEGLSHPGGDEIERMGALDRELGALFAAAVVQLLDNSGTDPLSITAIGSHGQTVRHRPPSAGYLGHRSFTLQIGDPSTIAEITGITTIADFRRRDIAAGGEGAPLAPAFHADAFAVPNVNRAVVNIGGFSNISILRGTELCGGSDTGPGNTLLNLWNLRHNKTPFDRDGNWSASGTVSTPLLQALMAHSFFERSGPKSTGKESFNLAWLDETLAALPPQKEGDVQATLAEFTANTIAASIKDSGVEITEVYACGGGAYNADLMRRLHRALPGATLKSSDALGLAPDWVEAVAFAWLARRTLLGLHSNAPAVTGAQGERILGGIFTA